MSADNLSMKSVDYIEFQQRAESSARFAYRTFNHCSDAQAARTSLVTQMRQAELLLAVSLSKSDNDCKEGADTMPNLNDYHAYKSTQGGSGGSSGGSNGPNGGGWIVIVIVALLLIYFVFSGASWDAIDSLLGLGFLAYLFFNWMCR